MRSLRSRSSTFRAVSLWASNGTEDLPQGMPATIPWQQLTRNPVWAESESAIRFALSETLRLPSGIVTRLSSSGIAATAKPFASRVAVGTTLKNSPSIAGLPSPNPVASSLQHRLESHLEESKNESPCEAFRD